MPFWDKVLELANTPGKKSAKASDKLPTIRRVRTAEGAKYYGVPIGTPIKSAKANRAAIQASKDMATEGAKQEVEAKAISVSVGGVKQNYPPGSKVYHGKTFESANAPEKFIRTADWDWYRHTSQGVSKVGPKVAHALDAAVDSTSPGGSLVKDEVIHGDEAPDLSDYLPDDSPDSPDLPDEDPDSVVTADATPKSDVPQEPEEEPKHPFGGMQATTEHLIRALEALEDSYVHNAGSGAVNQIGSAIKKRDPENPLIGMDATAIANEWAAQGNEGKKKKQAVIEALVQLLDSLELNDDHTWRHNKTKTSFKSKVDTEAGTKGLVRGDDVEGAIEIEGHHYKPGKYTRAGADAKIYMILNEDGTATYHDKTGSATKISGSTFAKNYKKGIKRLHSVDAKADSVDKQPPTEEAAPAKEITASVKKTAPKKPKEVETPHKTVVGKAKAASPQFNANGFDVLPKHKQGQSGNGYFAPNLWGRYGAAGVLLRHTDTEGVDRYLLVQRGPGLSSNVGKWQLPGGALNEFESDRQGAARELMEELQAPEDLLPQLILRGEHKFVHDSGWHYNNLAVVSPTMFDPTVDGSESSDAKWFTADQMSQLDLVPAFKTSLSKVLAKYKNPDDSEQSIGSGKAKELAEGVEPNVDSAESSTAKFPDLGEGPVTHGSVFNPDSTIDAYFNGKPMGKVPYIGTKWYAQHSPMDGGLIAFYGKDVNGNVWVLSEDKYNDGSYKGAQVVFDQAQYDALNTRFNHVDNGSSDSSWLLLDGPPTKDYIHVDGPGKKAQETFKSVLTQKEATPKAGAQSATRDVLFKGKKVGTVSSNSTGYKHQTGPVSFIKDHDKDKWYIVTGAGVNQYPLGDNILNDPEYSVDWTPSVQESPVLTKKLGVGGIALFGKDSKGNYWSLDANDEPSVQLEGQALSNLQSKLDSGKVKEVGESAEEQTLYVDTHSTDKPVAVAEKGGKFYNASQDVDGKVHVSKQPLSEEFVKALVLDIASQKYMKKDVYEELSKSDDTEPQLVDTWMSIAAPDDSIASIGTDQHGNLWDLVNGKLWKKVPAGDVKAVKKDIAQGVLFSPTAGTHAPITIKGAQVAHLPKTGKVFHAGTESAASASLKFWVSDDGQKVFQVMGANVTPQEIKTDFWETNKTSMVEDPTWVNASPDAVSAHKTKQIEQSNDDTQLYMGMTTVESKDKVPVFILGAKAGTVPAGGVLWHSANHDSANVQFKFYEHPTQGVFFVSKNGVTKLTAAEAKINFFDLKSDFKPDSDFTDGVSPNTALMNAESPIQVSNLDPALVPIYVKGANVGVVPPYGKAYYNKQIYDDVPAFPDQYVYVDVSGSVYLASPNGVTKEDATFRQSFFESLQRGDFGELDSVYTQPVANSTLEATTALDELAINELLNGTQSNVDVPHQNIPDGEPITLHYGSEVVSNGTVPGGGKYYMHFADLPGYYTNQGAMFEAMLYHSPQGSLFAVSPKGELLDVSNLTHLQAAYHAQISKGIYVEHPEFEQGYAPHVVPVQIKGQTVGFVPAGGVLLHAPTQTSSSAIVKFYLAPDGKYWYITQQGAVVHPDQAEAKTNVDSVAALEYAFVPDDDFDNGVLGKQVQLPVLLQGELVGTVPYGGTMLVRSTVEDPSNHSAKYYVHSNGSVYRINAGAISKMNAAGASLLKDDLSAGKYKVDNTFVALKDATPESVQKAQANLVPVKIRGKVIGLVKPGGTMYYRTRADDTGSGITFNADESFAKVYRDPDSIWYRIEGNRLHQVETSEATTYAFDMPKAVEAGTYAVDEDFIPGVPPSAVPEAYGHWVPVEFKGKLVGEVPAGGTMFWDALTVLSDEEGYRPFVESDEWLYLGPEDKWYEIDKTGVYESNVPKTHNRNNDLGFYHIAPFTSGFTGFEESTVQLGLPTGQFKFATGGDLVVRPDGHVEYRATATSPVQYMDAESVKKAFQEGLLIDAYESSIATNQVGNQKLKVLGSKKAFTRNEIQKISFKLIAADSADSSLQVLSELDLDAKAVSKFSKEQGFPATPTGTKAAVLSQINSLLSPGIVQSVPIIGMLPGGVKPKGFEHLTSRWDVLPSDVDGYLAAANMTLAQYLSGGERLAWVAAHVDDDRDKLSRISQNAKTRAANGESPISPPLGAVDSSSAVYDTYIQQNVSPPLWSKKAIDAFLKDKELTQVASNLDPYVKVGLIEALLREDSLSLVDKKQAAWDSSDGLHLKDAGADGIVLGNNKSVRVLVDQFGDQYVFKPTLSGAEKFRTPLEHEMNLLARKFGFDTPDSKIIEFNGVQGQLQRKLGPSKDLLQSQDFSLVTPQQRIDVALEHLLDWMLENDDTRSSNMKLMNDGRAVGIDKGRAWARNGQWDALRPDVTGVHGVSVLYSKLYQDIAHGTVDLAAAEDIYRAVSLRAQSMMKLPDAVVRSHFERAFKARPDTGTAKEDLIELAISRKNALANDMDTLWKRVFDSVGMQKPERPQLTLTNSQGHELFTGFTPQFLSRVLANKYHGKAVFFAGEDLEDMSMVFHSEKRNLKDGTVHDVVMGEAHVRRPKYHQIYQWLKTNAVAEGEGKKDTTTTLPNQDTYWKQIERAWRTLDYHLVDMKDVNFNQDTLNRAWELRAKLSAEVEELQTLKNDSATWMALSPEERHQIDQQLAMNMQYIGQINAIEDGYQVVAVPDVSAKNKFVYKAFDSSKGAAVPTQAKTYKVFKEQAHRRMSKDGYSAISVDEQGFAHTGENLLSGGNQGNQGQQYTVLLDTGERIEFRGGEEDNIRASQQGQLNFVVPNTEDLPASMLRIQSVLKEMGLDLHEAQATDYELFYWRHLAGLMEDRADAKVRSGAYADFHKAVDTALVGDDMAELAMWRNAFSKFPNTTRETIDSFVEESAYYPRFNHYDLRQPEEATGHPWWQRFDVSQDAVDSKNAIAANTAHSQVAILRSGGSYSSGNRMRQWGAWTAGQSKEKDQAGGSGHFAFFRQNKHSDTMDLWVSPHVLARTSTYSLPVDGYGSLHWRKLHSNFDFEDMTKFMAENNEVMIKNGLSLMDDIIAIRFDYEDQRNEAVKYLKKLGITLIRGLPVEDRLFFGNITAKQREKLGLVYKEHPSGEQYHSSLGPYAVKLW